MDAAAYLLAAMILAAMRLNVAAQAELRSFLGELATGWREFRSRTWLWAIVLQFALLLAVVVGALSVLGPVVAENELGGAKAWGLILTAQAVGLLVARSSASPGARVACCSRPRSASCCGPPRSLHWAEE